MSGGKSLEAESDDRDESGGVNNYRETLSASTEDGSIASKEDFMCDIEHGSGTLSAPIEQIASGALALLLRIDYRQKQHEGASRDLVR